ncbi:MAG TPA: prenyltransferase [Longimicrobiales bacterium]|nr:prenyltransferase [Longimicrobiales bacterium]
MLNGLLGLFSPPFLALSLSFAAAGAAAGNYDGGFSLTNTLLILLGASAAHAAMNALHARVALRHGGDAGAQAPYMWESAPVRRGLTPAGALRAGMIGLGVAGAVFVYFLADDALYGGGAPTIPLATVWLLVALLYADVFSRMGLGELAAAAGVGVLPVVGAAFVQDGLLGPAAVAFAVTSFFLVLSLALLDGVGDVDADRASGIRSVAVLLGRKTAARLFVISALAVPIFMLAAMALAALPWTSLLALLPFVLVVSPIGWGLRRPADPPPPGALRRVVSWGVTTALLLVVAVVVASYFRF